MTLLRSAPALPALFRAAWHSYLRRSLDISVIKSRPLLRPLRVMIWVNFERAAMGTSAIAHCEACGYRSDTLLLGGGIRSFRTHDARPIHCARCRAVTTANFKASPLACLQCGSAEVTPLVGKGPMVCPKCGEAQLLLRDAGILWD